MSENASEFRKSLTSLKQLAQIPAEQAQRAAFVVDSLQKLYDEAHTDNERQQKEITALSHRVQVLLGYTEVTPGTPDILKPEKQVAHAYGHHIRSEDPDCVTCKGIRERQSLQSQLDYLRKTTDKTIADLNTSVDGYRKQAADAKEMLQQSIHPEALDEMQARAEEAERELAVRDERYNEACTALTLQNDELREELKRIGTHVVAVESMTSGEMSFTQLAALLSHLSGGGTNAASIIHMVTTEFQRLASRLLEAKGEAQRNEERAGRLTAELIDLADKAESFLTSFDSMEFVMPETIDGGNMLNASASLRVTLDNDASHTADLRNELHTLRQLREALSLTDGQPVSVDRSLENALLEIVAEYDTRIAGYARGGEQGLALIAEMHHGKRMTKARELLKLRKRI